MTEVIGIQPLKVHPQMGRDLGWGRKREVVEIHPLKIPLQIVRNIKW
jgi:hypothetical protein